MPNQLFSRTLVFLVVGAASVFGAAPPPVEPKVVNLWPAGSQNNPAGQSAPNLEIFFPFNAQHRIQAAVVIFPGGGYLGLSPYERLQAEFFRSLGYTAIVVNYRVGLNSFPGPYADASRAMRLIRQHAVEWGYPADRIALLGGSAGGHLAALLATQPDLYRDPSDDLVGQVSPRPDRLILLYPVIKASGPDAHVSIERLLGPNASVELQNKVAPEKHVTPSVPATLLFHAADDPGVPAENSLAFARACWAAGVPAELHIFPRGGHGKDFAYDAELSPRWRRLTQEWLSIWLAQPAGNTTSSGGAQ